MTSIVDGMRRSARAQGESHAWEFLASSRVVQLATTRADGSPVLRVLNSVVVDGWVLFHGAVSGEKIECIGRRAVVSAYEEVALIPSYFVDPRLACPATTYYRSVQAHGVLREVREAPRKARVLQAFMGHQQPEGGHEPIDPDDPLYTKNLRAVRVFGVEVETLDGKDSLGQDRPSERTRRVVDGLWRRGAPGDTAAIDRILERSPAATPAWLSGPRDVRYVVHPTRARCEAAARLLEGQYWRQGASRAAIIDSQLASTAWVGAVDPQGALVGTARAISDRTARGLILDVVVAPSWQRRGIGRGLMQLLLDHPALKHCERLRLATRDRMHFYRHFGFEEQESLERTTAWMLRTRPSQSTSIGPDSSDAGSSG